MGGMWGKFEVCTQERGIRRRRHDIADSSVTLPIKRLPQLMGDLMRAQRRLFDGTFTLSGEPSVVKVLKF